MADIVWYSENIELTLKEKKKLYGQKILKF